MNAASLATYGDDSDAFFSFIYFGKTNGSNGTLGVGGNE